MRNWSSAVAVLLAVASFPVHALEQSFQDPDGNATLGVLVTCNDCKAGSGKSCFDGSEKGWLGGEPCGKCLLDSNFGAALRYGYDLHVLGRLTDADGKPVKDRFVKLFLPNGWGVRTRTMEDGKFHMTLGATAERKRKESLTIDVGTMVDGVSGTDDQHFAIYMMPQTRKPCAPGSVEETAPKAAKKDKAKAAEKKSGSK